MNLAFTESLVASSALALLVGVIVGRCVELLGKGGLFATRNELEAEVELNMKLLKEKYDWILERANFRRTLSDPIKLGKILELAKSIDEFIPKEFLEDTSADSFPAQESTSAGPDTALRAGGSSSFAWVCDKRGHRFFTMIEHGLAIERCRHCGLIKEPA